MKTYIFDLDGTLYLPSKDYFFSLMEFLNLIRILLQGNNKDIIVSDVINVYSKMRKQVIKEEGGFSVKVFPKILMSTYKTMCDNYGLKFNRRIVKKIYKISMEAFECKNCSLIKGAKEVLDFLSEKGDELILLTRGDDAQIEKAKVLGLDKWFSDIILVPLSKQEKFEEIANEKNKNKIYNVGNEFRTDILPAMNVGIGAIYVPNEENEKSKIETAKRIKSPRLHILDNITEIIKIYEKL